MKTVRTRFAPSPTGFQHIGGFRTALYAWLLARKHGGQFLLRIEDTDQERSVPGAIRYIVDSLAWLGIEYDEGPSRAELQMLGEDSEHAPASSGPHGPYIQSQRKSRYQQVAEELIAKGVAYRCDCTPERLEAERKLQTERKETPGYSGFCRDRTVSADTKHVVRFKIPTDTQIRLDDAVRGVVTWDNPSLRDTVLLKSDGMPTYHLACVVDDHDMEISHVMRGEEWLSTAPVHLLLYQALGWEPPIFCHLSHILGNDGKKLSKRHGAEAMDAFRQAGFLPEALVNYIVRIGWSLGDGDEQEIFTRQELIEKFSLDRLGKAGGTYDQEKLIWMNGVYIRQLSDAEFTERVKPFFEQSGMDFIEQRWLPLVPHIKERCKTLSDAVPIARFLFDETVLEGLDAKSLIKKDMDKEKIISILQTVQVSLAALKVFKLESVEILLRGLAEQLEIKPGLLFGVIRMGVTGSMVTPPLFESLVALGQQTCVDRLKKSALLVAASL